MIFPKQCLPVTRGVMGLAIREKKSLYASRRFRCCHRVDCTGDYGEMCYCVKWGMCEIAGDGTIHKNLGEGVVRY